MNFKKFKIFLIFFLFLILFLLFVEYKLVLRQKIDLPLWSNFAYHIASRNFLLLRVLFIISVILLICVKGGRISKKSGFTSTICLILVLPVSILFFGSHNLKKKNFTIIQPALVLIIPVIISGAGRAFSPRFVQKDDFGIKNAGKPIKNENSFNWQTDTGYINIDNPFQGILIVGGAGSGKTYSIINQIIFQAVSKGYTGFIYDYKYPELNDTLKKAIQDQKIQNRKIFQLDFLNALNSHRINPLSVANLPVAAYAGEYASTILKNLKKEWVHKQDFWADNAIAYLKSIIWYLRKHHPEFCTLPHAISIALRDYVCVMEMLSNDKDCKLIITSLITAQRENASAQVAGCISSLQIPLDKLNDPSIFWVLSGNDCDLNLNSPSSPSYLVVGNNPRMSENLSPVISLIATVLMKNMNQRNRIKSVFLLDEAPTLYIPGLKDLPNTGRSNEISTVFCCQDYSQMDLMYGHDESRVIRASLGNQFIGMVNDVPTAEQVSRLFGKGEKIVESKNSSRNSAPGFFSDATYSKGSNWQVQEKELIRPEKILSLPCGHFLGKTTSSYRPFFSGKIHIPSLKHSSIELKAKTIEPQTPLIQSNTIHDSYDLIKMNYEKIHFEAADIIDQGCKLD